MRENFTAEATVKALSEVEVSVDFAFSGELPSDTEVTIELPSGNIMYEDGTMLYFYYCNPSTGNSVMVWPFAVLAVIVILATIGFVTLKKKK